jgi:hypothetical protein
MAQPESPRDCPRKPWVASATTLPIHRGWTARPYIPIVHGAVKVKKKKGIATDVRPVIEPVRTMVVYAASVLLCDGGHRGTDPGGSPSFLGLPTGRLTEEFRGRIFFGLPGLRLATTSAATEPPLSSRCRSMLDEDISNVPSHRARATISVT